MRRLAIGSVLGYAVLMMLFWLPMEPAVRRVPMAAKASGHGRMLFSVSEEKPARDYWKECKETISWAVGIWNIVVVTKAIRRKGGAKRRRA